jgi:hypothetical protein
VRPLDDSAGRAARSSSARPGPATLAAARFPVGTDLVVLEIARELGGELLFHEPLEAPPRRVPGLLAALLGEVELLVDLVEVDVAVLDGRLVGLIVLVSVGFGLLAHDRFSVLSRK